MIWDRKNRPLWLRCIVAVLVAILFASIRRQFLGVLGLRVAFVTFYPAVVLAALYGGFSAGLLATAASVFLADYFWMEPVGRFAITNVSNVISILFFLAASVLISYVAEAAFGAQARANEAAEEKSRLLGERRGVEEKLREQRERLKVTLASIGDGVLSTDIEGRVTFINPVAAALTGTTIEEAVGRPVDEIFRIVNEKTRAPAEDIVERVLTEGSAVALANHCVLITPDGREVPIEDSAALIKNSKGDVSGVVLVFHDVTEKRRASRALRESEGRLRVFIEHAPASLAMFDREMCYLSYTKRWTSAYNLGDRNLTRISHYDVFPQIGDEWKKIHRRALAGEVLRAEADRFEKMDGTIQWIRWEVRPWHDEKGDVGGIVIFTEDITEQKQMMLTLRESEERFRVMADSISQLAWLARADGCPYWYNHRWYEYTGTTPAQMEEQGWQSVHDPVAFPDVLARWKKSVAAGKAFDTVFPLRGADGSFRQFLTRVEPVKNADGNIIQWCGTDTDITERKEMEDALRQSKTKLEAALASMTDAVSISDAEGRFIELNDAFATFHRFANKDQCLKTLSAYPDILDVYMPNGQSAPLEMWAVPRALRGETVTNAEYTLRRRDTGETWIGSYSFGPVRNKEGVIVGAVVAGRDITEQKRMEEEVRKSRDELELRVEERTAEIKTFMKKLEQSNQALQDFASIASHDLQEPLRKVGTFGNMLKQKCGESLGEQGKSYLDRVLDANRRMQSLLTGLLEYSRITTKADLFTEVDLSKILADVLCDLEVRIKNTGGEVYIGNLPNIEADPTQMRQLFQNLIGNALKFHKEGEHPVVGVRSAMVDGKLQIMVEDNGIGFDQQYIDRIFAPFQRLHGRSSRYDGIGMGLAICKKIVERHGGTITVESTPGAGAKFTVLLPEAKTTDISGK